MKVVLHQKVIQANSPKLLAEEVARFAEDGWRAHGDPVALVPDEVGRPTYWSQTLDLVTKSAQHSTLNTQP